MPANKIKHFLCVCVLLQTLSLKGDEIPDCSAGEYQQRSGSKITCIHCEGGTFMPEKSHMHEKCILCSKPTPFTRQIVVKKCTPTSDAEIGCEPGWYSTGHVECEKCTKCEDFDLYVGQECKPDGDTVCCPETGMRVKSDVYGSPTCEKKSNGNGIIHRGLTYSVPGKSSRPRCPDGTFISEAEHSLSQCEPCATAREDLHQVVVERCTTTRNSVIGCEDGYFKENIPDDHGVECQKCSSCGGATPHETQACGKTSDTVCCPYKDMRVEKDLAGNDVCIHNPGPLGQCVKGNYLHGTECIPCASGSFIDVDDHSYTNCQTCQRPDEHSHEIELAPCTTTRNTIIGCQRGFFRVESDAVDHMGECLKCTDCNDDTKNKYTGEECQLFADTVCCPWPGMKVEKDKKGPVKCILIDTTVETCGGGTYIARVEGNINVCLPCPVGTYMPTQKHENIECYRCSHAEYFNWERVAQPCKATTDAQILCYGGHFRAQSEEEGCIKCTNCSSRSLFEIRPCGDYNDAVCCPKPAMTIVWNSHMDKFDCTERETGLYMRHDNCAVHECIAYRMVNTNRVICNSSSASAHSDGHISCADLAQVQHGDIFSGTKAPAGLLRKGSCQTGEYLALLPFSPGDQSEVLCSPCQNGSFMDKSNHSESECTSCTLPGERDVVQECRRHHDTVFGVKHTESKQNGAAPFPYCSINFYVLVCILLQLLCTL